MSPIQRLEKWYFAQCNGEWEHSYGVKIETIDNPGWSVQIELEGTGTDLQHVKRLEFDHGPDDWMHCIVKGSTFHGHGDPKKLERILEHFLAAVAAE
jgi:hypothetical protein